MSKEREQVVAWLRKEAAWQGSMRDGAAQAALSLAADKIEDCAHIPPNYGDISARTSAFVASQMLAHADIRSVLVRCGVTKPRWWEFWRRFARH